MQHHTRVLINLRAYESNLRILFSKLASPCKFCAVVKANAYGHGLEYIAPVAVKNGVHYLAIAENWEAQTIRDLGITVPLIRLRPATVDEVEPALEWGVEEIVSSYNAAKRFSSLGERLQKPIPVHFALDTGICRMSFSYPHQAQEILRSLELPGIAVKGILGHYPSADEEDPSPTEQQIALFNQGSDLFSNREIIRHTANSAAGLGFAASRMDMVRFGLVGYGLSPSPAVPVPAGLEPVMSWWTKIVEIRDVPKDHTVGYGMTCRLDHDSRIATLPVGYADGYLRAFSNCAHVLIDGKRCPVLGRVSMDMVTVDVTHVLNATVGDDVVLMGQQGYETVTANELAGIAGTINYEIICIAGRCNRKEKLQADSLL